MASTEEHSPLHFPDMDPELATELFKRGAVFVLLDFPVGSQIGIDYNSWTAGNKFKGIKMIPPGVHFVYYSAVSKQGSVAPRIGFFHNFIEREILVKRWDSRMEDLKDEEVVGEELERFRGNLENLDPFLGPYPYQSYRTWFSLSNHMRWPLVERLQPASNGKITSQSDLVSMETQLLGLEGSRVDREHPTRIRFSDAQGLPIMHERPGTEIRFTQIPTAKASAAGCSSSQITLQNMDCSERLEQLLRAYDTETEVLGELQFAFVCFLIAQLYDAFEHWKRLVLLLCSCSRAISEHQQLYQQFIVTLFYHLKLTPQDFFVDIVSKDNFLTFALGNFFVLLEGNDQVKLDLKQKAAKFKAYLTKRFKWNFDLVADDYKPVVVE